MQSLPDFEIKEFFVSVESNYNFHGILRVKLLRDRRYPFFDSYLEYVFSRYETKTSEEPDLLIRLGGKPETFKNFYWVDGKYAVRENKIGYETRYKSARWSVLIDGIESPKTVVSIGANLLARPVLTGDTLYSLIRYKLAQKKCVLLHASGISVDGKGFFFAARGGVGKTITAIRSVNRGALLYGDDSVVITGEGQMLGFSVPFNLRFHYDVEKMLGTRFPFSLRAEIGLKKLISFLTFGRYRLFTVLPPEKIYPQSLGEQVNLNTAYLLKSGAEFKIEEASDPELFLDQLIRIIQFESAELIPLLRAYSHVYPGSAMLSFWPDLRKILKEALNPVSCRQVTLPSVYEEKYFNAIWDQLL